MPNVTERATEYQFRLDEPDDFPPVIVAWRGGDTWAVTHVGRCLNRDGVWGYEPLPSNRTEEFIATHRFDLETAKRLAQDAILSLYAEWLEGMERRRQKRAKEAVQGGG